MARKTGGKVKAAPPPEESDLKSQLEEGPEDEEQDDDSTDGGDSPESEPEEAADPGAPGPSFLSKLGGDYATLDEDAALARFQAERAEVEQLRTERQHYAWQLQQVQQQQAEAQRQAQFQAQQVAAATQAEKKAWKAPEFDPKWLGSVRRDEQGHLVPIHSGVDPTLPQKIQHYADWKAEQEQKFWSDPGSFIAEQIQDRLSQLVQQQAGESIQAYHRDREIQDWERANSAWFYSPQGQITPAGQMVVRYANDFLGGKAAGVAGLDLARKAVYGELVAQQHAPGAPAQTNEQKKMALLRDGAQRKSNRDGGRERVDRKTPVSNLSLEHRFRKAFEENGIGADDFDAVMTPD